jgi:hypothetical protein
MPEHLPVNLLVNPSAVPNKNFAEPNVPRNCFSVDINISMFCVTYSNTHTIVISCCFGAYYANVKHNEFYFFLDGIKLR